MSFVTPFRLFLLALVGMTAGAGFALVPAGMELPIHWNVVGAADRFAPREVALLLPLVAVLLVWGIILWLDRRMTAAQREAGAAMLGAALTGVTAIFLAIGVAIVAIGAGVAVSMMQVVAVALGALFVVLGNAMPKSRPNSYAGIRIPSTLRSDTNWLATHRLGGALAIAGGLVLILVAFLVPVETLVWWLLGCLLLPMLVASLYSLWLARRGG
jgi:uncharacterized membrane protein